MAQRNTLAGVAATLGITPQVHGDVLADKLNREAASAVSDLQKKVDGAIPAAPGEGEAPASTDLFSLRSTGYGWPFVTGAITVSSGETEIPNAGFGLGPVYKGERVDMFFQLGPITSSGATNLRLALTGSRGQGSAEETIAEAKPSLPNPLPSGNGFWAGLVGIASGPFQNVRLRVFAGSAGGTITIPLNTSMVQRYTIYTPVRKAASK